MRLADRRLTRRHLLASLAGLVVAPRALAQAPPIAVRGLNHLHLTVSNVQRSLDFYQRVLGMPLAGMQGVEADWQKPVVPMLAIGTGPEFISFSQGDGRLGGRDRIDHFGFGMDGFDASRVVKLLESHGIKSNVRMRADSTPSTHALKSSVAPTASSTVAQFLLEEMIAVLKPRARSWRMKQMVVS